MEAAQGEPNTPEALATLPQLGRAQLPSQPAEVTVEQAQHGAHVRLRGDVLHGDVSHVALSLNVSALPEDLYDDLPLFVDCLTKLGTSGERWDDLLARQAGIMGDIGAGIHIQRPEHPDGALCLELRMGTRALHRNVGAAAEVIGQRLHQLDFSDSERISQILAQREASQRSGLIGAGTEYAVGRAAAELQTSAALDERLDGFAQIKYIDQLVAAGSDAQQRVVTNLQRIADHIARVPVAASVVGDATATNALDAWLVALPSADAVPLLQDAALDGRQWTGAATAADVAYVGQAMPLALTTDEERMACSVLCSQLQVGFLWEQVRVRGGAYGARAGYNARAQRLTFGSYRDPHDVDTLAAFAAVPQHVQQEMDLSDAAIERMIIAMAKNFDRPQRPGMTASGVLSRHVVGLTAARRAENYAALLNLNAGTLRSLAERIATAQTDSAVCILSSKERLEAANSQLDGRLALFTV